MRKGVIFMFSLPDSSIISILEGKHSIFLVFISITIACCASYTALSMNQRMQNTSFFNKKFWLFHAAIAMGLGIWAMHFVGMSAFMLPITMEYDLLITIISIIPAILASYLAFYFANRVSTTQWPNIIAATMMGLGISSMHYIGMSAMKMEADYSYRPWIFLASIVIGIMASYLALYTFSTLQKYMENKLVKVATSILMGLAISSMHYTGMAAVVFYVDRSSMVNLNQMQHMDTAIIAIIVTVGIFLLLLISGLTSVLDRYVDDRMRYFDALTLFPNQRQLQEELYPEAESGSLAVIQIDKLEHWTATHGYAFGDEIIKEVGKVIQKNSLTYAKIYRIDGRRFAIFQQGKNEYESIKETMEVILSKLRKPLLVDTQRILIEVICAVSNSDHTTDVKEQLSNNMAVLKHPYVEHQQGVIEYDPIIHTYTFERQIVKDIRRAITTGELFLHYQPKIETEKFKVYGLEALLRWRHPVYGMVSPGVFIPILEENRQIFEMTDWVIQEVCRQVSVWLKEGIPFGQVSINIPGSYVISPKLLDMLKSSLAYYQIDSQYIELEITETSVINNIENAITAASEFRELDLSVALDDFGTGLSSLSYLKRLPISTIKIDKSFVDDVPCSEKDSAILKAIITLCYSLNLKVVIEGIETKEQLDFILSMKEKPHIQGYYYSRPLAATGIAAWIVERES